MLVGLNKRIPSVPWGIRDAIWGVSVVAGGSLLLVILIYPLASIAGASKDLTFSIVIFLVEGLMLLAVLAFAIFKYQSSWRKLGFRSAETSRSYLLALGVLMASLTSNAIYFVIVTSAGWSFLEPSQIPEEAIGHGALRVVNFLTIGVWGPFTEEIFFRGFILAALIPRVGALGAMVATSTLFALSHGSVSIIIPVFASGLLLAWLYLRTHSLWPCIAAHSAQNILAISFASYG